MRYVLAILIIGIGFWFWIQPREGSIYQSGGDSTMSDAEKTYYMQIFNHVMSHTVDGERYAWESYNSKGNISPAKTYASKSKALCRHYKETFVIGGYGGEQEGTACKRNGKPGWCRLKPGYAETCALEDGIVQLTFGELNVGKVDMGSVDLSGMTVTIPTTDIDVRIDLPETPDLPNVIPEGRQEGETTAEWMIK